MKIVYVGDNRNRFNYGCRATSTALSQLLSQNHEIVGRVYGNFRNTDTRKIFFISWLPKRCYEFLGRKKHWSIIKEWLVDSIHIVRRMKVGFTKNDFLTFDFEKSINNLIKCIPANKELEECDLRQYDFDALVVNGEGSFVFSPYPWREAMLEATLMYWAHKLGKKVYFLNAMFSGSPGHDLNMRTVNLVKNLFEQIDFVGVRELQSYDFAKKYFTNANIGLYPDALFTWGKYINDEFTISNGRYVVGKSASTDEAYNELDFTSPYICVSGSSSGTVTKNREKTIDTYRKLVATLKKELNINVFLVVPCEIDNFLLEVGKLEKCSVISVDTPVLAAGKILANASVYVTGRYHPAILASLGGTPCVFLDSNSHKTFSLQETLKYDNPHEYSSVPDDNEIKEIVREVRRCIERGNELRERISMQSTELSNKAQKMVEIITD